MEATAAVEATEAEAGTGSEISGYYGKSIRKGQLLSAALFYTFYRSSSEKAAV